MKFRKVVCCYLQDGYSSFEECIFAAHSAFELLYLTSKHLHTTLHSAVLKVIALT